MTATTDRWQTLPVSVPATSNVDALAERTAAIGVAVLIVTGFVASYTTLRDLATTVGQFPAWLAPVVPLSFDVGIVVLSLKVLMAARAGHRSLGLRALVLTLSVATVVANGASADHLTGRLLHAVPSAMFVICFETVVASARRAALATADGQLAPGPFRPTRWVLAPRATWTRWRIHVLTDHQELVGPEGTAVTHSAAQPVTPEPELTRATTPMAPAAENGEGESRTTAATPLAPSPTPVLTPLVRRSTPRAAPDKQQRLDAAHDIVRAQPDITAAALAQALTDAGHPVSLRTAHRVRDEVRSDASGEQA